MVYCWCPGRRDGVGEKEREGVGKLGKKEDSEFEGEGWRRLEEGNKLKEMMSQHARGVGRLWGRFEGRLTK